MSTIQQFTVAAIGGSGPKATAVNFVKTDEGVRPWAWVSNSVAAQLVPGMRLSVTNVSTGKVETSYTKDGQEIALKVPRVQVFLGGAITVDAPAEEELPEATFVISDAAAKYADAYRAKQAKAATQSSDDDTEPF